MLWGLFIIQMVMICAAYACASHIDIKNLSWFMPIFQTLIFHRTGNGSNSPSPQSFQSLLWPTLITAQKLINWVTQMHVKLAKNPVGKESHGSLGRAPIVIPTSSCRVPSTEERACQCTHITLHRRVCQVFVNKLGHFCGTVLALWKQVSHISIAC